MWAQFQNTSFGADLVAGSALVDLMKAQNDPRLAIVLREELDRWLHRIRRHHRQHDRRDDLADRRSGRTNDRRSGSRSSRTMRIS